MEAVFRTDVGQIRPHNEDDGAFMMDHQGQMLALVADGMGGHQAGDVASKMTKEYLLKKWEENTKSFTPKEAEQWLQEIIVEVNNHLFEHAKENPQCEGMGTTLVVAICNNQFVTVANVGDSRVYLKTPEGIKQLTDDHSLVGELVRSGQITEDEAMFHPRKNVLLRALGTEPSLKVDIDTINWDAGSYLVLCSDGLTNKLTEEDINERLEIGKDLKEMADQLVQLANERGGEDNITITIVHHTSEGSDAE